jgi:hypothetical protein
VERQVTVEAKRDQVTWLIAASFRAQNEVMVLEIILLPTRYAEF